MNEGFNSAGKKHRFKKGVSGNLNGAPKGTRKRTKLKKLIKDLSAIYQSNGLSPTQLAMVYQLYELSITDYSLNTLSDSIQHLYFFESDFGVKIGKSKNVDARIKTIQQSYAPSAKILKIIPNAGKFEQNLHKKFKKQNIRNHPVYGVEWFYKNDDLASFIDEVESVNDLVDIFGTKSIGQLKLFP